MMEGKPVLKKLENTQAGLRCLLPRFSKSLLLRLTVVASKEDGALTELNKLPMDAWRYLIVSAPAPIAISAKLSQGLDSIIIVFNRKIVTRKTNCDEMFKSSKSINFGHRAKCFRRGLKEVVILLGYGASLKSFEEDFVPKPTINIKSEAFYAYKEQYSLSARSSVELKPPSIKLKLNVTLIGPSVIGNCDELKIKAIVSGPETIKFIWTAGFADDIDQNALANEDHDDLNNIVNFLQQQTKSYVVISNDMIRQSSRQKYLAYKFSITVESPNMLFSTSNLVVERISTRVPMILILGGMYYFSCSDRFSPYL